MTRFADKFIPPKPKEKTPMNDGGPAFPKTVDGTRKQQDGMSLRDWFAGTATDEDVRVMQQSGCDRQAARYLHADAMIAEREKHAHKD